MMMIMCVLASSSNEWKADFSQPSPAFPPPHTVHHTVFILFQLFFFTTASNTCKLQTILKFLLSSSFCKQSSSLSHCYFYFNNSRNWFHVEYSFHSIQPRRYGGEKLQLQKKKKKRVFLHLVASSYDPVCAISMLQEGERNELTRNVFFYSNVAVCCEVAKHRTLSDYFKIRYSPILIVSHSSLLSSTPILRNLSQQHTGLVVGCWKELRHRVASISLGVMQDMNNTGGISPHHLLVPLTVSIRWGFARIDWRTAITCTILFVTRLRLNFSVSFPISLVGLTRSSKANVHDIKINLDKLNFSILISNRTWHHL